jgi:hypothetical protein
VAPLPDPFVTILNARAYEVWDMKEPGLPRKFSRDSGPDFAVGVSRKDKGNLIKR